MAVSVKLFQFFQQCHQISGIIPSQSNQKYLSTNLIRTISLICLTQLLVSTGEFFALEARSMFSYGYSFTVVVVTVTLIAIYLIFIWKSENTVDFIENGEAFIKKKVNSTAAYEQLIGKIELFHRFICFGYCIIISFLPISALPYSLVRYFIFDMGEDSYFLFLPCWYPFDWKTPTGYLVAWLLQCAGAVPLMINVIQFFNLLIGSCWLFIFVAEDITQDVAGFNCTVTTTTADDNRTEVTKRFCDIVQIYSDAKQLVTEFNEINEYSLFAFFSFALFGLASMLVTLQFQLWDDVSNSFEIGLTFLNLINVTSIVFLLCEPGAMMTNQFNVFSAEFSRCNWHCLSVEMQRMYLIFLSDTQQSIKIQSYVNITCERETLKEILNGAYSYFSTFRNFEP